MRIGKDDLALEKAVLSGDTDLVYMVVMHLKDNLTLGEFLMAIRYHPVALKLYIKYCKDQDRRTLVDLFYQDDQAVPFLILERSLLEKQEQIVPLLCVPFDEIGTCFDAS
ncbi:Vacuolar protein sorting-associated protein 16-like protein [Acropora cervicornis]|uniref:Vacuolar protein sorting-associated protein 16-like protein n=1 Tax=Acropora cervicornis TaxID=6130 RepID=A0AAD9PSN9_ACRCE|nr:Vacuolar protein sorting-associated protein 16-like protein [Acropora cervicornis]